MCATQEEGIRTGSVVIRSGFPCSALTGRNCGKSFGAMKLSGRELCSMSFRIWHLEMHSGFPKVVSLRITNTKYMFPTKFDSFLLFYIIENSRENLSGNILHCYLYGNNLIL